MNVVHFFFEWMLINGFPKYEIPKYAKMGSIKDRNGMDLTEAEDIKKSGRNTQKNCTKKIFTTQIIMMV